MKNVETKLKEFMKEQANTVYVNAWNDEQSDGFHWFISQETSLKNYRDICRMHLNVVKFSHRTELNPVKDKKALTREIRDRLVREPEWFDPRKF